MASFTNTMVGSPNPIRPPRHLVDLQRSVVEAKRSGNPRATEMHRSLVDQLNAWNPTYLGGGATRAPAARSAAPPRRITGIGGGGGLIVGKGKEQRFDYGNFLESGRWRGSYAPMPPSYEQSFRPEFWVHERQDPYAAMWRGQADAMTQAAALTNQQMGEVGGGRPGLRAALQGRGMLAGALQGVTAGSQAYDTAHRANIDIAKMNADRALGVWETTYKSQLATMFQNMATEQGNIDNLFRIAGGVEGRAGSLRGDFRDWKNADIARTDARRDRQMGIWGNVIGAIGSFLPF